MGRTKQTVRKPDVITRKKKMRFATKQRLVQRDVEPFAFVETDLLDTECVSKLRVRNPQVMVTDCPWPSNTLASNHDSTTYKLASRGKLRRLFLQVRDMFTPTADQRVGHLFIWFTSDMLEFALELLRLAGYTYIGINSWHKATLDRNKPYKMSPHRGNAELFLIGEKLFAGESRVETSRGFCASPFISKHSSKPLDFYTKFLPFFARNQLYGRPWAEVEKVDFFSRHSQGGFLSVGNEFYGRRDPSIAQARPSVLLKKRAASQHHMNEKVTVSGAANAEWAATIVGERDDRYQVRWTYPTRGSRAVEWVDKDVVVRTQE